MSRVINDSEVLLHGLLDTLLQNATSNEAEPHEEVTP